MLVNKQKTEFVNKYKSLKYVSSINIVTEILASV